MSGFPSAETTHLDKRRRQGPVGLALCAFGIVAVWGWVLPAIGSLASVSGAIQRTEGQGINAGAIYYTDVFYSLELRRANQFVER